MDSSATGVQPAAAVSQSASRSSSRVVVANVRMLPIDGVHFLRRRDPAGGLDVPGTKHVLALREGTTENAAVCNGLLADLRCGLDL